MRRFLLALFYFLIVSRQSTFANNCQKQYDENKKSPSIRAYLKVSCELKGESYGEEAKWLALLSGLRSKDWSKIDFGFEASFHGDYAKLYDYAFNNKQAPQSEIEWVDIWDHLGKQAKQKSNQEKLPEFLDFALKTYPCSWGSTPEEIAYVLSQIMKVNAAVVLSAVSRLQARLGQDKSQHECSKKVRSVEDKNFYANMLLKGLNDFVWTSRNQIPEELSSQLGDLYRSYSQDPHLKAFRNFYDAYKRGENYVPQPIK